jgi:glycosyltransferase involved in cell wall biosynthesis
MIRRALKHGQRIIAVSRSTKDDLLAFFDVEADKIDVIYQGVAPSFHQRLPDEELQRWLGTLGLQQPYLLFVGNPKPHKNLDNVVQAYARALQIGSFDAPLVCVGARDGADFKVRQRAAHLGIAERVKLLGHVAPEALPAIYQGASVFLYPTLYEGFGLPVVEAMASGTPVLTSNTSALYEIANGYAHLVDPLDVEEMAKGIAHLMRDEAYRRSLSELGKGRAADFNWRRTAEQTLDIYRQVLDAS